MSTQQTRYVKMFKYSIAIVKMQIKFFCWWKSSIINHTHVNVSKNEEFFSPRDSISLLLFLLSEKWYKNCFFSFYYYLSSGLDEILLLLKANIYEFLIFSKNMKKSCFMDNYGAFHWFDFITHFLIRTTFKSLNYIKYPWAQ
jgi:hypothetical protein